MSVATERGSRPRGSPGFYSFFIAALVVLSVPLIWWPVAARFGPPASSMQPSYLPALEAARDRYLFDESRVYDLKEKNPGFIIIGDSMSLRINPERLAALSGRPVVPFVRFATGSAHWYLIFKNYVVASGVRPRRVIVFFRDTQLTDPLFRMLDKDRFSLDQEARDREEELNTVVAAHLRNPWFRAHALVDRAYAADRTREWLRDEPTTFVARIVAGNDPTGFLQQMNGAFSLARLRSFEAADIGEAGNAETDFAGRVGISTLSLMLDLAAKNDLALCFVHVLRRPTAGRPPVESTSLRRYISDLRRYIEARGAFFFEDRDEPELATLAYDDGDHILDSEVDRYTDLFWQRMTRQK